MRRICTVLSLSGLLCLAAAGAGAETYHVLAGTLADSETGREEALTGAFEVSVPETQSTGAFTIPLLVEGFELSAGDRSFTPRPPIEYQGLTPWLFLEIANQIQVDGDGLGLVLLRAGGEEIPDGDDAVIIRFLEFRSDGEARGGAVGALGDDPLPRRLQLQGTLYEVEKRFEIVEDGCFPFPVQTGGLPGQVGGGSIELSAGNVVIGWDEFDLSADEQVTFVQPGGVTLSTARVTGGGASSIEGQLRTEGAVVFVDPATDPILPTLEELGITAPDGADVTFVDGILTVTTEGDLLVDGGPIALPGLTQLVLIAAGDVVVASAFVPPADIVLEIRAGGAVDIGDGIIVPGPNGDVVIDADEIVTPSCRRLRAASAAAEREVGRFALIASAAQPVEIDVRPWSARNRVLPGQRRPLPVALLGSEQLAVRDVDARSLRLGPGEAAPWFVLGRGRRSRIDVNRDRERDLVALFSVRAAEIAFGDRFVCLVGETRGGVVIEGCDAIDTIPR